MNPDDLDAMDECVPFTKFTLDNLLGFESNNDSYRHYFQCFQDAQKKRPIESKLDEIRKNTRWNYEEFLMASGTRKEIGQVAEVMRQLKMAAGH